MIKIQTKPATCQEQILMGYRDPPNICALTTKTQITQPSHTYSIYRNEYTEARIFSSFQDKLSYLCGSKVSQNATTIQDGYTDIRFQRGCYIVTSQLKIYSPVLPSDETDLEFVTTLPDLSSIMEELAEDMQANHQINMTKLFTDFSKLKELLI